MPKLTGRCAIGRASAGRRDRAGASFGPSEHHADHHSIAAGAEVHELGAVRFGELLGGVLAFNGSSQRCRIGGGLCACLIDGVLAETRDHHDENAGQYHHQGDQGCDLTALLCVRHADLLQLGCQRGSG